MKKFLLLTAVLICSLSSPLYSQDVDQTKDGFANPDVDAGSLKAQVEKLESQNRDLAAHIDDLEDRVTDLEDKADKP